MEKIYWTTKQNEEEFYEYDYIHHAILFMGGYLVLGMNT